MAGRRHTQQQAAEAAEAPKREVKKESKPKATKDDKE